MTAPGAPGAPPADAPDVAGLGDVLPAVAAALGAPVRPPGPFGLPEARSAVVVLVDGLGLHLLERRGGHAPFLRGFLGDDGRCLPLTTGFPSTTATSMGTFGTGRGPGAHGLVGTDVLDPARGVLFSELAWDPAVDPRRWQPVGTVFEELVAAGVDVVRVGPAHFDGSGLTEAALRGGRFLAAPALPGRVDATVRVLQAARRSGRAALVYLYWGDLDKVGHVHGCESWQWGEELEAVDGELARLARLAPGGTLLAVTADHGMVDVPFADRVDVAHDPVLSRGVRLVGGEARALHLYCAPGAAEAVLRTWTDRFGELLTLRTRADAVAEGWFGPVSPHVEPRIGDVVASAVGRIAVVDSRTARPEVLGLLGLHGARTPQEQLVPLLTALT